MSPLWTQQVFLNAIPTFDELMQDLWYYSYQRAETNRTCLLSRIFYALMRTYWEQLIVPVFANRGN